MLAKSQAMQASLIQYHRCSMINRLARLVLYNSFSVYAYFWISLREPRTSTHMKYCTIRLVVAHRIAEESPNIHGNQNASAVVGNSRDVYCISKEVACQDQEDGQ